MGSLGRSGARMANEAASPPAVSDDAIGSALERLADLIADRSGVAPEALDAAQAARLCGVCRSKFHSMNSARQCPAPVELGDRCPRWLASELRAWLRAGAPARAAWQQIRAIELRRAG